MSNSTTSNGMEPANAPYARLESTQFGIYDIWQEKIVVGRKSSHREVDVDMGTTSLVSRIHFELSLISGTDFQLRCLGKNGLFMNNNYLKTSSSTILPKQCTLRFPSTDICITFSSLITRASPETLTRHISTDSVQSRQPCVPTPVENSIPTTLPSSLVVHSAGNVSNPQQVILVTVNQQNHQTNSSLPSLYTNISNFSSSNNVPHRTNPQVKSQYENFNHVHIITNQQAQISSNILTDSTSPKVSNHENNENHTIVSSPVVQRLPSIGLDANPTEQEPNQMKNGTKPPFSYAQLIVQAILSAPDKQMTLSQIYNYISAQYPYYEANNRGWQNSIRHNLSLNRYFIRLARKDNESGKGSFWRLDQACEEKLIDHAFRHRKQRSQLSTTNSSSTEIKSDETHSPSGPYPNDPNEFLLADLHASNPSTPLSPMTSPLVGPIIEAISPIRSIDDQKRKFDDETSIECQVEELLSNMTTIIDEKVKRRKIDESSDD